MKVLIVEDEPLVAKDIQKILSRIEPDAVVLGVLTSVEETRRWLAEGASPDLILADIQLSDGISFEVFEDVKVTCPIIFTTAYDQYAIRVFKLNSIDYLLKPVDERELVAALRKFKQLSSIPFIDSQAKTLIQ